MLLQVAVVVVLQSPRVQTLLGKYVIGLMQDKMDADITFASASVRPFDAIVLEDLLVKDRAPVVAGMDTVLYVNHLSARFSLMGLLQGDNININRAKLDGGCFHLVIEPDPQRRKGTSTNLQRIFRLKSKEDPQIHWGNLLRARSVEINEVHFRMENLVGEKKLAEKGIVWEEGVIDWNHLNAILSHASIGGLKMQDDLLTCTADHLCLRELATGLVIDDLAAQRVRVGKGNIHLENVTGQLGSTSTLNISRLDIDGKLKIYEDFIERVRLDILLREGTSIDMKTVSHFGPHLSKMGFRGRIRGRMCGTVSDFQLMDMVVDGISEDIHLEASGRMAGIPDIGNTTLDFQVKQFRFGMADLARFIKDWAPQVNLSSFRTMAPGEEFTVTGRVNGLMNDMDFVGDVTSSIGTARADIYINDVVNQRKPIVIGGLLKTQELNLGRLLGNKDLGELTLMTNLEGTFPSRGVPQLQLDTLHIAKLQMRGYPYTGLSASGYYKGTDINFILRSTDPNLRLMAKGNYLQDKEKDGILNLDASLDYANLQALNLDRRGVSVVDGFTAQARLTREDAHLTGQANTSDFTLTNDSGLHPVSEISVYVDAVDSLHRIRLDSQLMEADFSGDHSLFDCIKDLRSLVLGKDLSALTQQALPPYSGATYSVQAQVKDLREPLAFLVPGMYVEKGTRLQLDMAPDGLLNADVLSGRIALNRKFIKDMKLHVDNNYEALSGEITGSTIAVSGARLNNSRFSFYADDNQVGLGYVFDNEAEDDTRAELYVTGELSREEKGLAVSARALPSNVYYKGNGWSLSSGEISYYSGNLRVNRLQASHENQQLLVNGGYSPGKADTLAVTMEQFDIALANTILGEDFPAIEGHATGKALLFSAASGTPGLLASILCDSTRIDGMRMGQLRFSSAWDDANSRFVGRMSTRLDGRTPLSARAHLIPSAKELNLNLQLDRFNMGYARYFLRSIFHEFSGDLSGEVALNGKLKQLQPSSKDLRLENGRLTLDFTRVPYNLEGSLELDNRGLHFKNVSANDGEDGHGNVTGGILFRMNNLRNIRMDTHVRMQNMRALALQRGVNPLAWGSAYASGKVDVTGPLNKVSVVVDATSTKSGEFHLPLGNVSSGSSTELLTFTQSSSAEDVDLYEQMMAAQEKVRTHNNDFHFSASIKATPGLRAYIDISDDNTLNATGNGIIEIESSQSQGFTLGGDYTLQDGSFHFSALNLVSRKFTIQEGSTVRFNGDVWDTDLNVKGLYVTKASLSNLLPSYTDSEASGGSARRTVNCGITLTGKLRNPEVKFDIDVPDLNPVMQGQVESALNSEDKIQKQFVYLLIAGNFLPTEESGITTNGSEVLFSNVSSIMSGQLNNIFQKLDIPLDLGLNYQTTQAGKDLFDVAVSTQLFNNRVIVNGTVGNKQLAGGATTNEVAGDIDIEIKLNRSGTFRVSLFSHSADQYTYYLDNSQRNGGGISYQREFNSFGQFFRELFIGRKKREAMALESATHPTQSIVLEVDSNGKTTPTHDLR